MSAEAQPPTTSTEPSSNPRPWCVGLDLGKRTTHAHLIAPDGSRTATAHPTADIAAELLALLDGASAILAAEWSGGLAPPILKALEGAPSIQRHIVTDTDTADLRRLLRITRKTDPNDAKLIAELVELGTIPERRAIWERHATPWHHLEAAYQQRQAIRSISWLTGERQRLTLRIKATTDPATAAALDRLHAAVTEEITAAETIYRTALTPDQQRLTTLPGVTPKLAIMMTAAIGDAKRFETAADMVRYLGGAPPHWPTSGDTTGKPKQQRGSTLLQNAVWMWGMMLARETAQGRGDRYAGWCVTYQRYKAEGRARVGLWTCRRKLLRCVWHILTTGEPFDPSRTYPPGTAPQIDSAAIEAAE